MLDSKLLRTDVETTAEKLARRGFTLDVAALNALEETRKSLQVKTQELQNERNVRAKSIGKAKASGQDIEPLLAEVAQLKTDLAAAEDELKALLAKINEIAQSVPNVPHESVPVGKDEDDNQEISRWGDPKVFDFEVKDHVDISAALGNGLDFETATKSGT